MSNWRYFLGFGIAAALFAGDITSEPAALLHLRVNFVMAEADRPSVDAVVLCRRRAQDDTPGRAPDGL